MLQTGKVQTKSSLDTIYIDCKGCYNDFRDNTDIHTVPLFTGQEKEGALKALELQKAEFEARAQV